MASTLSGQGKGSRGVIHIQDGTTVGAASCGSTSIRTVTRSSLISCKRCLTILERQVNLSNEIIDERRPARPVQKGQS